MLQIILKFRIQRKHKSWLKMAEKKGVLITFSVKTQKVSPSEKTIFFRKLYGWKQVVPAEEKTYEYERPGILDEVPHEKVDQSSFLVPENHFEEIEEFFEEWHSKVIWKTFKVLLDKDMDKMFREMEELFNERINIEYL